MPATYFELQFTSAANGLVHGTSGYCTVKATQNIPSALRTALESLSHYRHIFLPGDKNAVLNPVAWSHTILDIVGRRWHVLSRTSAAGFDYSHRSNNFSHHLALADDTLPSGGPAWLMSLPGLLQSQWDSKVEPIATVKQPRSGIELPQRCKHWELMAGDAGWGGTVAAHLTKTNAPVVLVYNLGQDVFPLIRESLALLDEKLRWSVTFSTFFAGQSVQTAYRIRGVLSDSAEAAQLARLPQVFSIDLTHKMPSPQEDAFVRMARDGGNNGAAKVVRTRRRPMPAAPEVEFSGIPEAATSSTPSVPIVPPPFYGDTESNHSRVAIPPMVLFGGGLATGVVLAACIYSGTQILAVKPPAPQATAKLDPFLLSELNRNGAEAAAIGDSPPLTGLAGGASGRDGLNNARPDPSQRYEVDKYLDQNLSQPATIRIPRSRWPRESPFQLEVLGLPPQIRIVERIGGADNSPMWSISSGSESPLLVIRVPLFSDDDESRTLVLDAGADESVPSSAHQLAGCVLVIFPEGREPYRIALCLPPTKVAGPITLTHEDPTRDLRISDPTIESANIPATTALVREIWGTGLLSADISLFNPARSIRSHYPDQLDISWNAELRLVRVTRRSEIDRSGPDGVHRRPLEIRSLRVSRLVDSVYVDLLTVDTLAEYRLPRERNQHPRSGFEE